MLNFQAFMLLIRCRVNRIGVFGALCQAVAAHERSLVKIVVQLIL
jgi:hypothetical protein